MGQAKNQEILPNGIEEHDTGLTLKLIALDICKLWSQETSMVNLLALGHNLVDQLPLQATNWKR